MLAYQLTHLHTANMKRKINVAVLFGGKSAEHEVSVQSARNVVSALDKNKYAVRLIGIDKLGAWLSEFESKRNLALSTDGGGMLHTTSSEVALIPGSQGLLSGKGADTQEKIDVVFPVLHGPCGEDGTIQGLLKLADVAFVGAGVLGSAIGMDKDVTKRLLRDAGISVAPFLVSTKYDAISFGEAQRKLSLPLFVKPANLGSSVGVCKVHNAEEYSKAIDEALRLDTKVLIEKYIRGREIECAVLGNEDPIASALGEIIPHHEFYSYEAKYLDQNGAALVIPADLPEEVTQRVRTTALRAFKVLCCEGMGRVEFFVTRAGKVYVNEINTIPGFTNVSMYPKLWEASGLTQASLLDRLIELAIEKHQSNQDLEISFKIDTNASTMHVPFYSQKWNLKEWKAHGFKNEEDARYWEKSSCGVLCLKMAVDALLLAHNAPASPPISEYIKKGQSIGAYSDTMGWKHAELAILAGLFGCSGEAREQVDSTYLRDMLRKKMLPIVSIKWAFEEAKTFKERFLFWKKTGGHLALIVDYKGHADVEGFYVHHTSTRQAYNWQRHYIPIKQFEQTFTGRCVIVARK